MDNDPREVANGGFGQDPSPFLGDSTKRAADLDLLKTVLVVGMIGAHVIQLITSSPEPEARVFSAFIDLITFSGFMFAFGIGVGLPSAMPRKRTAWQTLRPILLLLIGLYVSSFAFALLVERERLTTELVMELVTLTRLFGWSEFLATFFVLSIVIAVGRPVLLAVGRSLPALVVVLVLCFASTLVVTDAALPVVAAVVGTTRFASFPLLAYLPWFLLGIWYGSHPVRWWHLIPAALATGGYWVFTQSNGGPPSRFPPSALWVIGSAAPLFLYLFVSRALAAAVHLPAILLVPGRHVLSFLVLSNLAIFSIRYLRNRPINDSFTAGLVALGIILSLSVVWLGVEAIRKRRA